MSYKHHIWNFVPTTLLTCQVHHIDEILSEGGKAEILVVRRSCFAMATRIEGEGAGSGEYFPDLGGYESEGEARGAGTVVGYEQGPRRTWRGEVCMVDRRV